MTMLSSSNAVELSASESGSDVENGFLTRQVDLHSSRLFRTTKAALASVLGVAALVALSTRGAASTQLSKVSAPGVQQLDLPPVVDTVPTSKVDPSTYSATGKWLYDGQLNHDVDQRHDGNKCQNDEEEYRGLCYKKCFDLTKGVAPKRCSPFSCSKTAECNIFHEIVHFSAPCNGFDVAGNINGETSACPHTEGSCLQNEELFLDECYKKCSILTANLPIVHNYRTAAATCCQEGVKCLEHFKTSPSYDVGGGAPGSAEAMPHPPLKVLTEAPKSA